MKNIKEFDSFVNEEKENLFDILKDILDNIPFDSQSYKSKNSIYDELERLNKIEKIKILLNRIIKDKCSPIVATDVLFDMIDLIIGTSSTQEKELKQVLNKFFTENIS